ncbi:hypothetical protein E2C01_065768 [Portunus trituberculatus]|uniref:Uncharacterized protein n=1 Tax=Portunus trituberculatus TaxID=210409 RepID=A0A5B7HGF9_PORTR|nr:hypothetical protein [Portunus trituberculatus]
MHSRFVYPQWKFKSGLKLVIIGSLNEILLNKGLFGERNPFVKWGLPVRYNTQKFISSAANPEVSVMQPLQGQPQPYPSQPYPAAPQQQAPYPTQPMAMQAAPAPYPPQPYPPTGYPGEQPPMYTEKQPPPYNPTY